jgi:agmatine deiminase
MKKKTKILLGCAALVIVIPTLTVIAAVLSVVLFLNGLEFGEMEPMRVVDTSASMQSGESGSDALRIAAEWEPVLGALIAWPLVVPKALVVEIASDDTLYLLVDDEAARDEARVELIDWGIDLTHVEFIVAAPGHARSWPRDWGPPALYAGDGAYALVDPDFDDYPFSKASCDSRLYYEKNWFLADFSNDDAATRIIADTLGFANTRVPVALTGGNALVDGLGTVFSTCTLINENNRLGVTEDRFFSEVGRSLGVSRYVVIPNFELFGIQHIDCFLKLLDEERILVARPPDGHSHSERAEAIVRELSSLTNVNGRPYEILRIDTPPYWLDFMPAYTNSLILNRKVLVPLFGIPADQDALETWRHAMPGYEVLGFEHDDWMWFDALHCRVRAVWDPEMLRMEHRPLDRVVEPADEYPVAVRIRGHSHAGLVSEDLELSWRLRGEDQWHILRLEATAEPDVYEASILGAAPDNTVEYFLSAADRSGRSESLPRTAPDGFFSFSVADGPGP